MRPAARLFGIVQYLRGRRLTTAAQLAQWLEVSERAIYRDVADLVATGVPIDGEAGVGYRIAASFDLPPLMFTFDEIDALVIGARFVELWGGPGLANGARSALAKIAGALPREKRAALEGARLYAPGFFIDPLPGERLETFRRAIGARHLVERDYRGGRGRGGTGAGLPELSPRADGGPAAPGGTFSGRARQAARGLPAESGGALA